MKKKTWITGRFIVYMILLVLSLIFTQALRSSASAVLFIFMFIMPILSFIMVLVARASVKVYVECDNTRVEKDSDVEYEIRITNDSFIPLAFLEAHIVVPEEGGVRCTEQRMMVSLAPFGVCTVKHRVRFHYRGRYDIGVLDMRIKDPLGLYSAALDDSVTRTVIVFPRMMDIAGVKENAVTDVPTDLTRRALTSERSEQANIRSYVGGDALKDVHWKLSSKLDELLVRDYNINDSRHTYIVCDLTAPRLRDDIELGEGGGAAAQDKKKKRRKAKHNVRLSAERKTVIEAASKKEMSQKRMEFAEQIVRAVEEEERNNSPKKLALPRLREDILGELAICGADRAVELAIAAVMSELRSGSDVTLIYNDDSEKDGVHVSYFPDTVSFAAEVLDFALTPVSVRADGISSVFSAIGESTGLTVRFVTANLNPADVSDYMSFSASTGSGASDTSVEVYLAETDDVYEDPVKRSVYISAMKEELASCAVRLSSFRHSVMPDGSFAFAREEN